MIINKIFLEVVGEKSLGDQEEKKATFESKKANKQKEKFEIAVPFSNFSGALNI